MGDSILNILTYGDYSTWFIDMLVGGFNPSEKY